MAKRTPKIDKKFLVEVVLQKLAVLWELDLVNSISDIYDLPIDVFLAGFRAEQKMLEENFGVEKLGDIFFKVPTFHLTDLRIALTKFLEKLYEKEYRY